MKPAEPNPLFPDPPTPAEKPSTFGLKEVAQRFAENTFSKAMMFYFALGCLFVALGAVTLALMIERRPVKFIGFDPQGNYFLSSVEPWERAKHLHYHTADMATVARFSLNPNGMEFPDLAAAIFSTEALEKLKNEVSQERQVLAENQIHQKVELFEKNILDIRGEQVLVEVSGQLIQLGTFRNQPFQDKRNFKARYVLKNNPDWLENKLYPEIVWDYQLKYID